MDFLYSILHAITSFLNAIYAILFFPSKRGRTPNIDDPLLLLPAIQISEKIKNGQVSEHFIFSTFFPCSKLMSFSFFSLFIFLLLTSLTVDL